MRFELLRGTVDSPLQTLDAGSIPATASKWVFLIGPQEMPVESVDIAGLRIAYERAGDGPPLVLLHGYVGDGPTTWRRQIDEFCDEFTVVAWDAPGAGRSADPPEDFGIAGYADCLAMFIREIGLDRPHLVGLSFGGALALEFCGRYPAIPSTLILVSAYAGWRGSLPPHLAEQRLQQALALSEMSPDAFVDALLPTMFSDRTPSETVEAFGAAMRAFHPAGFRAMARASAEDVRGALPRITVPTLLVYGDNDARAPLVVAERLHEAIPGSTLVVLPRAGHVCNAEGPEEVNALVRTFLHSHR
jgi:pimeloyl-ACP methyl ester carboxylesterase